MSIIKLISSLKGLAAIGAIAFSGLHSYLIAVSSFTIPYSLAMMFDDKLVAKFGVFIVIFLGIYLVVWCTSQILLRVNSSFGNRIGLFCVVATNLCDIICAVCSCLDAVSVAKIMNIVLSVVMVSVSWLVYRTY